MKIHESVPEFPPSNLLENQVPGEFSRLTGDDCRLATFKNDRIVLYLEKIEYPDTIDNKWKELFLIYQKELYVRSYSGLTIGNDKKSGEEYREHCRKSGIDILIQTIFSTREDSIGVRQKFVDSYYDITYGEIEYIISNNINGDPDSNTGEFYYDSQYFYPIKVFKTPHLKIIRKPALEKVNAILAKNLNSILNFYSIDSDTDLMINGEIVGRLPLNSFKINRGQHLLQFRKRGSMSQPYSISLRGGDTKNFLNPLESTIKSTSLYLWSEPQNKKIFRDGLLVGTTPYLFSQISPGEKNISINKNTMDKVFIKNGIKNVYIYPENLYSTDRLNGIFETASSIVVPEFENGIFLLNTTGEYLESWAGLRTHTFFEGNYLISAGIPAFPERGMGDILITMTNLQNSNSIYINEDRVGFLDFKNYKNFSFYKIKSNSLSIKINLNSQKKNIVYSINETEIAVVPFERYGEMRMLIQVRGSVLNKIHVINNFSIKKY